MARRSEWTEIRKTFKIASTRTYNALKSDYASVDEFLERVWQDPYRFLIFNLNKTFKVADEIILSLNPQYKDSIERTIWACWRVLKDNENDGDTCCNANALAKVIGTEYPELKSHIVEAVKSSFMFHYDNSTKMVSLYETWSNEALIAEVIKDRVENPWKSNMNWKKYTTVDGFELTKEQSKVLELICNNSIVMLNGSAGVGKTSSMKALITMLKDNYKSYTVLAPTGIAAKRISEVAGVKASTIHRFIANPKSTIGDFLILEETSMIGVNLLGKLFRVLPKNTKILFICDEAQLASISCGNIVQDIIDSGIVPTAKLTKVFRYGIGGIATVATDIRMGNPINAEAEYNDYRFVSASNKPLNDILNTYDSLLAKYSPDDIMVLSPFNVREAGTFAINNAIQDRYNNNEVIFEMKKGTTVIKFKIGDKVVNTENNYHMIGEYGEMPVMNGDIGYIRAVENTIDGERYSIEFDHGVAYFEKNDMYKLLLGYSISIHKSQGSQAKAVIAIADKSHSFFLSRNLLYVAMSRAQEQLIAIGDVNTINNALSVQEEKQRETYLKEMLLK